MHTQRGILLVLALTAAFGVQAQIYKSIGPDGKVIYTDTPPASKESNVSVIKPTAPSAPPPVKPDANAQPQDRTASRPASPSGAKQAIRVNKTGEQSPSPAQTQAAMDPALGKAMITIMGHEELVKRTEELCIRALPTSYKRYSGAADGWRQRNASLLEKQKAVLASLSAADRQSLQTGTQAKVQSMMAPVLNAPAASQIKWCDKSADEINSKAMDPAGRPDLSGPVMAFQSRR